MSLPSHSEPPVGPPPRRVRPPATRPLSLSGMTLFLILILLVLLFILPSVAERVQFAITRGQQRAKAEVARKVLEDMPESSGRFAWVAKTIEPSVVGIEVTRLVHGGRYGDEWTQLFAESGEGSGVIVDEAGYIVTNAHVVDGAAQLTVKLSDGSTVRDVELVGADPLADLAVLKINASGLTAAPWGDSDPLEVGDEVLAVGNPYRLARTVTAGIISAKDRPGVVGQLAYEEFLQTDAAVNPGNSGGPLVNMKGEVVGINTAIVGPAYQGISFAIPSNRAREVCEHLKTTGEITPRSYLGVRMWDLNEQLALQLELDEPRGVLVRSVEPGSPAERAGIQRYDVIVEWNGQRIDDSTGLALAVARAKIGSKASVVVIRKGQERRLEVTVGQRPLEQR
jgi:serine protease Do